MRRRLLILTTLVPFVLAPRPPEEAGSGAHPRLGKEFGEQTDLSDPRVLGGTRRGARGGILGSRGASRSFQVKEGGCGSRCLEREKEMGLSLREEGNPGGVSHRDRGPGTGKFSQVYFWNI